jgi:hypothetical protein
VASEVARAEKIQLSRIWYRSGRCLNISYGEEGKDKKRGRSLAFTPPLSVSRPQKASLPID